MSQPSGHGADGTEPPSAGEGILGLLTDRGPFGVPGACRAKETMAAFSDFHIIFVLLSCVFSVHL